MAESFRIENLPQVLKSLEVAGQHMELAAVRATNDLALRLEGDIKANLMQVQNASMTGPRNPAGGGFPHRRSGRLANSIYIEPRRGLGSYSFNVGAGMEYARILELGWASGVNYPYMKPSADALRPQAKYFFEQAFARYWKG
jgi:hypothetical protein